MPVLSNSTVRASPSVSIAPAPLTITPRRGAREPGDERDRRGEDQRAWRRDDHDRERPDRVAAYRPGQTRNQDRGREEESGVPVGHPHERGALRLRLLDEPDERRVRALAGGTVRADVERGAGVRRAAEHRHPARRGLRQRLAAQRARVDHRLAAGDRSVDRDDLAGPHDDDVADLDAVDRHLLESVTDAELRDLRCALDQAPSAPVAHAGRRPIPARRHRRTSSRSRHRREAPRARARRPSPPARSCRHPGCAPRRCCGQPRTPARPPAARQRQPIPRPRQSPEPTACRRPPTTIAATAIDARIWARRSINQASSCASRRGLSRGGTPGRAIVGAGAVVMTSRFAASSAAQIRSNRAAKPRGTCGPMTDRDHG